MGKVFHSQFSNPLKMIMKTNLVRFSHELDSGACTKYWHQISHFLAPGTVFTGLSKFQLVPYVLWLYFWAVTEWNKALDSYKIEKLARGLWNIFLYCGKVSKTVQSFIYYIYVSSSYIAYIKQIKAYTHKLIKACLK